MKTMSYANMVSVNPDKSEAAEEHFSAKHDEDEEDEEASTDLFSDTEIDTRLKCLCLSVTKNALD